MTLFHRQRSADVPVGLVFNLQQYAALLLMLAQVTGYTPKELVYCITDAHIYEQQLSAVEKLIAEMPNPFPAVNVDPGVTDIFAFRPEHFTVEGYVPKLGRMIIWTPV
jgi:thymidylate synthase